MEPTCPNLEVSQQHGASFGTNSKRGGMKFDSPDLDSMARLMKKTRVVSGCRGGLRQHRDSMPFHTGRLCRIPAAARAVCPRAGNRSDALITGKHTVPSAINHCDTSSRVQAAHTNKSLHLCQVNSLQSNKVVGTIL